MRNALNTIQQLKLFKHATNGLALGFVGLYVVAFASIASNGNHIYTIYRFFPVVASLAIALSMWRLPDNSLLRLFYLAGLFAISWLGV
ncbi:hypothetical protein [Thiothrix unzii]|uniref:Uncharacterized protein n=1 Tax=Thiothrix unzii TaxID=111769 RepID=A0A975IHI7_9GAMM|nr:hypothetical protein [Thiothrix unzii]QTR52685.1 hypothetical protein J9260_13360 [Thiothrix unzii]